MATITHSTVSGEPNPGGGLIGGEDWDDDHVSDIPLANYAASANPAVTDDDGDGYSVGSKWYNTTLGTEWTCLDASTGAAVWIVTPPPPPVVGGFHAAFSASTTALNITTSAFAVGTNLVLVVGSRTAKPSSISQTNVTWTERLNTSGTSQHLTYYTGVVAGGASGTTCTVNFAVARLVQAEVISLDESARLLGANFTSISSIDSNTGTAASTLLGSTTVVGGYYIWAVSANAPSSSYTTINHPFRHVSTSFGGAMRMGVFRAMTTSFYMASISSGSTDYINQLVRLT